MSIKQEKDTEKTTDIYKKIVNGKIKKYTKSIYQNKSEY